MLIKVANFEENAFVVYRPERFNADVIITEVVSGFSQNFNYPLNIFFNNVVYYGKIGLLSMPQNRGLDDVFSASILMINQAMPKTSSLDFGTFSFPFYSYGNKYCIPVNFTNQLKSTPVVIASVQLANFTYSQAVTLWVQSASDTSVVFCMQELLAFSGHKVSGKINYYAATPDDTTTSSTKPAEVGRLHFESGVYKNQVEELENRRYCKTLLFKYRYHEPPHIFVTPQNADSKAGMVSAWVNNVSNSHAVICAKNQNDAYFYSVSSIQVNYLVKGILDICSNHTCPMNKECFVDSRGNPACGCKKSCPLPDLDETLCGDNYVTYKSKCYMYKESCQMYGEQVMEKIQMAYPGVCKG